MDNLKALENLEIKNTFSELGAEFYQIKSPDPVTEPYLVDFNPDAAELIGLDPNEASRSEFVDYFSGNKPLPGSFPLAMVYSGYQFGVYNPRLGDGRGLLLGEIFRGQKGKWDLHLKGAGPTRFARGFDGRATLRASIREYLGGEALHGLGIPTSRSLAIIGIRDLIHREIPELGAILIRLCESHIRFGSFEHFYYTNQPEKIAQLADYVIRIHHPDLEGESEKYRLWFRRVIQQTAGLIALWQAHGFVHGVMNTDNMAITGITFDYGPYGFLDRFNPAFTPNHTDSGGRYAFGRQPEIGYWNLGKLGEALSHLIGTDAVREELEKYQPNFNQSYREKMAEKLGLSILDEEFAELTGRLFKLLYSSQADYTNFFRRLSDFPSGFPEAMRSCFGKQKALDLWLDFYDRLIQREDSQHDVRKEKMDRANPRFILRNYLLQRAIDMAVKQADFSEIRRLRVLLKDPYREKPELYAEYGIDPEFYASATPESFVDMQLSCSS